jgi:hypothetical protein
MVSAGMLAVAGCTSGPAAGVAVVADVFVFDSPWQATAILARTEMVQRTRARPFIGFPETKHPRIEVLER